MFRDSSSLKPQGKVLHQFHVHRLPNVLLRNVLLRVDRVDKTLRSDIATEDFYEPSIYTKCSPITCLGLKSPSV